MSNKIYIHTVKADPGLHYKETRSHIENLANTEEKYFELKNKSKLIYEKIRKDIVSEASEIGGGFWGIDKKNQAMLFLTAERYGYTYKPLQEEDKLLIAEEENLPEYVGHTLSDYQKNKLIERLNGTLSVKPFRQDLWDLFEKYKDRGNRLALASLTVKDAIKRYITTYYYKKYESPCRPDLLKVMFPSGREYYFNTTNRNLWLDFFDQVETIKI